MTIHNFINHFAIRPVDAIVLNKKLFGMVDHFVIYAGIIESDHCFVANYVGGVKIIPNEDITRLLQVYVPNRIDPYPGPENKRKEALQRAFSLIGQKAYNYVLNNCEHFKNFVHHGIRKSEQVEKAGAGTIVAGIVVVLIGIEKRSKLTGWGILIILIGVLVTLFEKNNQSDNIRNSERFGLKDL